MAISIGRQRVPADPLKTGHNTAVAALIGKKIVPFLSGLFVMSIALGLISPHVLLVMGVIIVVAAVLFALFNDVKKDLDRAERFEKQGTELKEVGRRLSDLREEQLRARKSLVSRVFGGRAPRRGTYAVS